jgi:septum formation inhibitor MinC
MQPAPAACPADELAPPPAHVVLKGTARGLEIQIVGEPSLDALRARLIELLAEAPSFFAGANARVTIDGVLPPGALACLEDAAARFDVRVVEVGPIARRTPAIVADVPAAAPRLAEGSGPVAEPSAPSEPADAAVPAPTLAPDLAPVAAVIAAGPRLVSGPVRSGVIVEHRGHVIVIGDVNPGAEVRAEGSIVVLGRLRGIAHAGIEPEATARGARDTAFIIALALQPQQLRIGRMVARAGDVDHPSDVAEIAYANNSAIVVERFSGRLASELAASL